jgi:V/A-type H+-transporting ATPase subunit I
MEMMNAIGYISELDEVSMEIVRHGCVHIVNALNEINQNDFTIMTPDQNTNILTDLCFIKPYSRNIDCTDISHMLEALMDLFKIDKGIRRRHVEESFDYESIASQVADIYKRVMDYHSKLEGCTKEKEKISEFIEDMNCIRDFNLSLGALKNLNYYDFTIGRFSKDNYDKLKDNIENISSIIYEINTKPGFKIVMTLTPKVLKPEIDRIFTSLNYEEISIPYDLQGTPGEIIEELEAKLEAKKRQITAINDGVYKLKNKYAAFIDVSYSRIRMYEKVQAVDGETACTTEFFYMAGWVPVSEKNKLQQSLAKFGDRLILIFKPQIEVNRNIVPPTKLKNNWILRPFETIVNMYGIPSYNEMDPTSFLAISYMLMFGCMFGDVGQGFIFVLAGILMSLRKPGSSFGGLIARLGISSMVFGFMFGSVFGQEGLFKPLLFPPMENINAILLGGVALGIVFTTVGFVYGLINAFKRRDLEDGVFGRNGLAGLLFYWIILLMAYGIYSNIRLPIPVSSIIIILCALLVLMALKQPIANLISGRRPLFREAPQDYYIESGFGIIETLLSMFSNTVSFIRVGAFALNHVGLFVAFATIANMMQSGTGSVAMLILGNIIVIGLEGLVVFIQGLRLEYYELFSKYYEGNGVEYKPVKLVYSDTAPEFYMPSNIKLENTESIDI